MRVRCAITTRYEDTGRNNGFHERFYIPKSFVNIAKQLGIDLIPVLSESEVDFISKTCDGLIITGSNININPKYYGQPDEKYSAPIDEYKVDKELLYAFMNKPVLGICGGMEALNIFYGGTLHYVPNHMDKIHNINIIDDNISAIESYIIPDFSRLDYKVNSYHKMACDKIGKSLIRVAVSDDDVTECIISKDGKKLGVQWHPEIMTYANYGIMFEWLKEVVEKM